MIDDYLPDSIYSWFAFPRAKGKNSNTWKKYPLCTVADYLYLHLLLLQ
jgi:hypothetical protein